MLKPNIILTHGALGSSRYFAPLKKALSEHFQVFDLDFDGHGNKPLSKPFSIELFTSNLCHFIMENGLEKSPIFGYSMGGYVALNAALKHPHLIGDIVTLGTKFDWTPEGAQREVAMLNPTKIEEKVPHFAASLKALHTPGDWKKVMQETVQLMLDLGNGKGLKMSDYSAINQNVTIGIGTKDKMVTIAESKSTANLLPNGMLTILEDLPHPIEMVDVEVLSAFILTSLENKN